MKSQAFVGANSKDYDRLDFVLKGGENKHLYFDLFNFFFLEIESMFEKFIRKEDNDDMIKVLKKLFFKEGANETFISGCFPVSEEKAKKSSEENSKKP